MSIYFQNNQNRYDVERRLGEGGMGVAYLVRSQQGGRAFFLKQLKLSRAADWKAVELFTREAKVLSQLSHPGIPAYVDFFQDSEAGEFVLVQTYLDGVTLQHHIDQKLPLSAALFGRYLRQALEILVYLHGMVPPVVHRDITPRNLLVAEGRLYLVDFGAVKSALAPSTSMTTVGTFGYMSPEQVMGQAEPASDLYSLGMSFLALATLSDPSRLPLDPKTGRVDAERALAHLDAPLRTLLCDLIRPGLAERIPNAQEALRRLDTPTPPKLTQRTEGAPKPPAPTVPPAPRRWSRRLGIVTGAVGLVLSLFWLASLRAAPHEIRTLGGWWSGHARLVPGITGGVFGDFSLLSSPSRVEHVAFGRGKNARLLASADRETLIVWDSDTGAELTRLSPAVPEERYGVALVQFTDDGEALLVASVSKVVVYKVADWSREVFDVDTLNFSQLKDDFAQPKAIFAPNPQQIWVAYSGDGEDGTTKEYATAIYDARTQRVILRVTHPELYPYQARGAFSPDGAFFALGNDSASASSVPVWRVPSGELLHTFTTGARFEALAFSPDEAQFAVLDEKGLTLWRRESRTQIVSFPVRREYSFLACSLVYVPAVAPHAMQVAVACGESIQFFRAEDGARLEKYEGHADTISQIAVRPDGRSLASGSADQTVKLWELTPVNAR